MAYTKNPNAFGARDGVEVSEVARLRPMLDTRPHCIPDADDRERNDSIRGGSADGAGDESKVWFNKCLRSGAAHE